MNKRKKLAALLSAMTLLAVALAVPAYAVDISGDDGTGPVGWHKPEKVRSDFGPLFSTDGPMTVTLGDEIEWSAGVDLYDDGDPEKIELRVDPAFDMTDVIATVFDENQRPVAMISPRIEDNAAVFTKGQYANGETLNIQYTVSVVRTLTVGPVGMSNELLLHYGAGSRPVTVSGEPVYATALTVKAVDTALPTREQVTSSTGKTVDTVPGMYQGQFVQNPQFVLYADEGCTRPVDFIPSFRRYDVCPSETPGYTRVLECPGAEITVVGLPAGTYWLQSIMPPEGKYGAPADPVEIQVGTGTDMTGPTGFMKLEATADGTDLVLDYAGLRVMGIMDSPKFRAAVGVSAVVIIAAVVIILRKLARMAAVRRAGSVAPDIDTENTTERTE